MKLSVSAFRAQASAQRKILSSFQNQLNYGACNSFPALGVYKLDEKPQIMVDSTGISPTSGSKPNEHPQCSETSAAVHEEIECSKILEEKEEEKLGKPMDVVTNSGKREELPTLEKNFGRNRSKSNQRWMKLRTTVQLSGAMSSANQKSKPALKREDSFLKRFSTRQIPETQETVDTGDETETLNGSQTQNEVNRRRRKRRKEMSKTVINPDENFYFYWLMTVTVCVLYNLWTLIVRQSFPELQKNASSLWYLGDGFTDAVFICDIVVQFRTGYLEQGLMVYNSQKLATHYLKSRAFILDMLSLLPLDFLQLHVGVNPLLRFPRFLKIYRVYNYYYMVESRTVYPNLWRVVNLIHILLILAHWFGCFYYLLSEAEDFQGDWVYPYRPGEYATLTRKYLGSLYWSTLTLTTIGDLPTPETNAESRGRSKAMTASGQSEGIPRRGHKSRLVQFNSNYGYLFTIISYLIGVFIFATIVGQVGNVITNRNANRLEFERLLDGAKTYMRHHKVPGGMKRRVLRWYDYSWSRGRIQGGGDINTALGLLPDKLKTELALHVNLSVLKKVTIFQECQPEFLHDLVLKMKAYIFTPGDLICRKGEVAREMFIIADGILDVISETGRVLTTMKAGDFFGEIGILNLDGLNKRTADVRSVGYSELFSLSREDVLTAMKDYPEAQEILQSLGRKRLMEAKNASKMYKAQGKQPKDHDSSGDSDTAGKRIVEKLRSDVKGLKNALRRSRRGMRTKEAFEKAGENSGIKACTKKHSILRRMSHVQSSDEYEVNNDSEQPSIGAGLPLLQRLKLLKEKQEKERNKSVICGGSQTNKNDNFEANTTADGLPFSQKLKLLKHKEANEFIARESSVVSSTVRTQVTGVRFEKSTSRGKANTSKEAEITDKTKADEEVNALNSKKKVSTEIGILSLKDKLKLAYPSQGKEKILATEKLQESETSPTLDLTVEKTLETSVNMPHISETEISLSKILGNKCELPKSKEAWKLLKNSSISCTKPDSKVSSEENKLIVKVSKKGTYLSKSDTVLEKQKTIERDEEKRSRSISPSDNSKSQKQSLKQIAESVMKERKRSRSVGHSPKIEGGKKENYWDSFSSWTSTKIPLTRNSDERNANVNVQNMIMKKYNSISDLSPEYSGLPFVKQLKILNERQKLEELEKELLVRSVSLDVPERPTSSRASHLIRSQSEVSAIEFKNVEDINFRTETETERERRKEKAKRSFSYYGECNRFRPEPCFEFRKVTCEEKKRGSIQIHSEGSIPSPESNETVERRHLKSILKKLSAEDSTSDEEQASRIFTKNLFPQKDDNTELKKLMRAPTIEGYAARHKKLTKSVTFDSDILPTSPDSISEQAPDESKEKGFSPMSPTAILTLQLSNLSMIPIASPKKTNDDEKRQTKEEKCTEKKILDTEIIKIEKIMEEKHDFKRLDIENKNPYMPSVLQNLSEKNFQTLPLINSLGDEFFVEIKREIMQVFQKVLEQLENKIQSQMNSLQTEVQNRGEVIVELRAKIRELEIKRLKHEDKNNTKDPDVSDFQLLRGDSFETIRDIYSPFAEYLGVFMPPRGSPAGAENSSVTKESDHVAVPQINDFSFDHDFSNFTFGYTDSIINYEDQKLTETEDDICPLPSHAESANHTLELNLRLPDLPSYEERELEELSQLFCSTDFTSEKNKLKRNFSMDESSLDGAPKCKRLDDKTGRRPIENRLKESFTDQVTEFKRSFGCSPGKSSEFVALNIDDGSNSSDAEDLHHKDWEVQMLVKELAKKNPNWEIEEEEGWMSENEIDVEHLSDVRKLQRELNALRQIVCEGNLPHLTPSELDILETIIETKNQKISQLAKSSSSDDDEKSKKQKILIQTCHSGENNKRLKNNHEQRKKPCLRQKIGQAFSFDFHDIDSRKPKLIDHTKSKGFCLRKQKTISGSCREHQSLYDLWHTSSRLRDRVFEEDSDRAAKSMTGSSPERMFRSSLPILISNFSPREKTCDMRMSLPVLSAKELRMNFQERLTSSFSTTKGPPESDIKQSCDSVFTELEFSRESGDQKEIRDFNSPSTSGLVRAKDYHPNKGLNSFIKSVGQKVKQVIVGDGSTIRNQVPTISKLCDVQPKLKEQELVVCDNLRRSIEGSQEEEDRTAEYEPFKSFDSNHDSKTDSPDI